MQPNNMAADLKPQGQEAAPKYKVPPPFLNLHLVA